MSKTKLIECALTSEWSDGSIVTTNCTINPKTGEIDPEVSRGPVPTGSLDEEYITLPGGDRKEVCQTCHEYVLKTAMVPGVGKTLNEAEECSNPNCSDEY
jgi:hypothetical protein